MLARAICSSGFQSIYNTVYSRSHNFIQRAGRSNNYLVKAVFNDILAYNFAGHNILFGSSYKKKYSSDDQACAGVLRSFILSSIDSDVVHGSSPIDSMLRTIATDLIYFNSAPYVVCFTIIIINQKLFISTKHYKYYRREVSRPRVRW